MKKLFFRDQKGMTLLEVILAIAILAIVIGPFVNFFALSARQTQTARKTLESTFVAQKRMESLQMLNYLSALKMGQGERILLDGYYVETICTPYHMDTNRYFQVVALDGEGGPVLHAVPPSGDISLTDISFSSDIVIRLKIQNNGYTWSLENSGIDPVTGTLPAGDDDPVIIGVNLMQYSGQNRIRLLVDSDKPSVKVLGYVPLGSEDKLLFDGDLMLYKGYLYRVSSMLKAVVKVYEKEEDGTPVAVNENILSLRNQS